MPADIPWGQVGYVYFPWIHQVFVLTVECRPGYADVGGQCQPCERGYYKEINAAAACRMCPTNFTTAGTGATSMADCNIRK